jgi:hypothetical protein
MTIRAPLYTRIPAPPNRAAWVPFEQNRMVNLQASVPFLLQSGSDERIYPRRTLTPAQSWFPPNLTMTLLATPPPFVYLVRTPVFTRIAPKSGHAAQVPFTVNLLSTTLSVVAGATPRVQQMRDAQINRVSYSAALKFTHVNLLNTLLSPAITNMFSSTYWGLQYEPQRRPQSHDPVNNLVLGITAGTQTPFVPMEFPNPTRRRVQIFSDSQGSTNLLSGIPAGSTPFTAKDFANPTLRKPLLFAVSSGSFNLLFGIPPVQPGPFSALDFPNPRLRQSVPPDTSNVSFALQNTPPVIPPGQSSDWATTPIRYVPRMAYFEHRNAFFPPPPPTPAGTGTPGQYGDRVILPAKKLGETVLLPIDFISKLGPNESILTAVCTSTVYTGIDPNPSAMIVGLASISGTIVDQMVTGGVVGTIYEFLATATTSLGQTLELSGYLAIVKDLP